MNDSLWKPIEDAPRKGGDIWLGWKPFRDENAIITSEVVPRIGRWDIGSKSWICQAEDHGDPDGHRMMPFDPQPDYFCAGYIPPAPTH